MIQDFFKKNGYFVGELRRFSELNDFEDLLRENISHLEIMDTNCYRENLLILQNKFNLSGIVKSFIDNHLDLIIEILDSKKFSYQTVGYLRGVRPDINSDKRIEYLDFHRERFYSDADYIKHQINIHLPLLHYDEKCSMLYVPNSHLIPDNKISTIRLGYEESGLEKGSTGHKLGLTYAPKKIISGIDISLAKPVPVKLGQFFIFDCNLIHGGGKNNSQKIRFSSDFSVIPNEHMYGVKNYHEASYHPSKALYVTY